MKAALSLWGTLIQRISSMKMRAQEILLRPFLVWPHQQHHLRVSWEESVPLLL